jgi:hypothetical protein
MNGQQNIKWNTQMGHNKKKMLVSKLTQYLNNINKIVLRNVLHKTHTQNVKVPNIKVQLSSPYNLPWRYRGETDVIAILIP